ncbi:alpha/beta hydrolase [Candidatus Poribacteria bacterium]|nr:alpha/beta hydrolase [Candidatus Poribacteria bacterium]MYF54783.1 alpha/beta hydrolase [Candidatus Poribacteria bacterium]
MFIEIDNLKVAYQVNGTGESVILLHGWGGEANSFKPVMDWMSRYYKVFALDLPGFGLSEKPSAAWDASDYATFLSGFFEKLKIRKAHLIGHSYGGRISIVMAAHQPHLVDKLILVDSAGIIPPRTLMYFIRVSIAKCGRLIRHFGSVGNKFADALSKQIGSKDYREAGTMRATLVKSVNQDLRPLLPKIQAATLLIWGENDNDTPISSGEIMSKEIPNSELVILKDAGHFSYLDQFPQFCKIVGNFLA